jgi:hypothetical protein
MRGGIVGFAIAALLASLSANAQEPKKAKKVEPKVEVTFPPKLPDGKVIVTDTSPDFLKPPPDLREGIAIAKTPPTIDFAFIPGQDYAGKPWSNWGDSVFANGKYYVSIGDHLAPAGNGFVFEYDPATKAFRKLLDLKKLLNMPEGHYAPGKIHSRLDMGDDGWLYCSTHRGSPSVTNDKYFYKGDWIVRCNPATGESEVVVQGPVPKHCIPTSVLDPKRLIYYGGTAAGSKGEDSAINFFAYDCKNRKLLYSGPDGPARYMIFAKSTGRIYYTEGTNAVGPLVRFDPDKGTPEKLDGEIGIRSATQETPQGIVYTVSTGQGGKESKFFAFDVKTEKVEELGPAAVGKAAYITTLDVDPTGRYVYYMPGAHGGAETDGAPVVQYDTKTKTRKVIAFLHPFYQAKYGCLLRGTYSAAMDATGETLYVAWNVSRGTKAWDSCAMAAIHIPASERQR